ncbi:hypothetical protein HJG60_010026 [Phyllostomus discolor]|uniref:L1 transposable element RRM domain-containing protein n=1 Tax=Phyllostomus discolor TaxID=89673 RepID=A0A834B1U1_9CHIR|nr:hypothetical protein HJG60_010026 [Phyllostomus discolor]
MKENFPNLAKEIDSQEVQEAQRVPKKLDPRRITPRHIIITSPRIKDKDRILKAAKEKETVTSKGVPIRLSADFSKETLQARRGWKEVFQVMKGFCTCLCTHVSCQTAGEPSRAPGAGGAPCPGGTKVASRLPPHRPAPADAGGPTIRGGCRCPSPAPLYTKAEWEHRRARRETAVCNRWRLQDQGGESASQGAPEVPPASAQRLGGRPGTLSSSSLKQPAPRPKFRPPDCEQL